MRAVVSEDFGSGPTLTEVETPAPGPSDIRIKVSGSSLNGFDTSLVRGLFNGILPHRFPVVLGRDFAGTVDAVGADVTTFAPEQNVFGVVLTFPLNAGGFGEYLVVPAEHSIAPIPDGVDVTTAGVIGLAGSAAMAALDAVHLRPGETVLVSGATGGVGAFILQLATAAGTVVIATATPAETDHVRRLGAAHVIDHTKDLAAQVRALAPAGVDVALHLAGDPGTVSDLVADGGRFATLLPIDASPFACRGITATAVAAQPNPAGLTSLAEAVAAGRLVVPIQRSYTMAEVPQAFADFAAGTLGKLAVQIDA
ncbi:NADP-dependent oxidoreductase [Dactylosporangium darangshiense]|uniref:NADP-dependent oxidoreductase n=1 Tax=Dactylosporangium darangshiense TaxID=579108 RepID=A0ABP8DVT0_9ACTN